MRPGLAILVILGLGWLQPGLAAPVEIALFKKALLAESHYRLRDIASIETDDARLARELGAIVIGRSPRPNYQAQLSHTEIGQRLEAARPGVLRQIEWSGRASVRIQSLGRAYDGQRLLRQARQFLAERLGRSFDDYRIEPVSELHDVTLAPGRVEVQPRVNESLPYSKRYCVWLDIHVDGRFTQTLPVWFELSIYAPALIALEDFERGEGLTRLGVFRREVDVARARGTPLDAYEDTRGQRLRGPLAAGSIVTREILQPRPAVEKGRRVDVLVQIGGVALATEAVALSDGRVQQKIRVKNLGSGEDYPVVVTGPAQTRAY